MIIIGQQKDLIVPLNYGVLGLSSSTKNEKEIEIKVEVPPYRYYILGVYRTEKRAKEILAEITDTYYNHLSIYRMPEE